MAAPLTLMKSKPGKWLPFHEGESVVPSLSPDTFHKHLVFVDFVFGRDVSICVFYSLQLYRHHL